MTTQNQVPAFKLIKKLSAKTVMGAVKSLAKELKAGEVLDCFEVIGKTIDTKTGETDNGDWVSFTGRFEAVNLITGIVYRAGNLFLPSVAEELVLQALEESEGGVELAFRVSIREDESSATGYVYEVAPLMAPHEDDELARLRESLPQLAAPSAKPAVKELEAPQEDRSHSHDRKNDKTDAKKDAKKGK